MDLLTIFVLAIGLSMDSFAVAISCGLAEQKVKFGHAVKISLAFALSQGILPLIGWLMGTELKVYVEQFDHWIAFGLLAAIGGKMIWESRSLGDEGRELRPAIRLRELLVLGVATSIDALAAGVSFAFLDVHITTAAVTIGVVTAALSLLGVWLGHYAGRRLASGAELVGGLVLIGIGTNILISHLAG